MIKTFCNLCDKETTPGAPTTSLALPEYGARIEVTFQPLPHAAAFHICPKCKLALLRRLLEHLKGA